MGSDRRGKTAVVLGGGGGMGRHAAAAATALAGVGKVLIADRDLSAAARVPSACGHRAEACKLAVVAMGELEDVHRVVTGWNGEGATPEPGSGPAAIEHGIAQTTGTIPVVRGGQLRSERSLRPVALDYPGLGRRRARTFGHPEPVTLHRTFDLAESVNVTHGRLRFVAPLLALARLCDRGLLSTRRAVALVEWAERRLPSPSLGALASNRRLPPLFALAEGERDGVPASVGVALTALPGQGMGAVTGVPLAVAAGCLLSDSRMAPGVHPPESALDPNGFFAALAPHCAGAAAGRSALLLTRSWEPGATAAYRSGIDAARRVALAAADPS